MKIQSPIPSELVLSILAQSYLITHRWGESLAQSAIELGRWSEEILRGDRLPPLPFPEATDPDNPTHEISDD